MELTDENNKLTYVHTSYYEPVSVIANSHQTEKNVGKYCKNSKIML